MYGPESIRAINAVAAAKAEDDARRARGVKPASTLGKSLRRSASLAGLRYRSAPDGVYAQGREVALS